MIAADYMLPFSDRPVCVSPCKLTILVMEVAAWNPTGPDLPDLLNHSGTIVKCKYGILDEYTDVSECDVA